MYNMRSGVARDSNQDALISCALQLDLWYTICPCLGSHAPMRHSVTHRKQVAWVEHARVNLGGGLEALAHHKDLCGWETHTRMDGSSKADMLQLASSMVI